MSVYVDKKRSGREGARIDVDAHRMSSVWEEKLLIALSYKLYECESLWSTSVWIPHNKSLNERNKEIFKTFCVTEKPFQLRVKKGIISSCSVLLCNFVQKEPLRIQTRTNIYISEWDASFFWSILTLEWKCAKMCLPESDGTDIFPWSSILNIIHISSVHAACSPACIRTIMIIIKYKQNTEGICVMCLLMAHLPRFPLKCIFDVPWNIPEKHDAIKKNAGANRNVLSEIWNWNWVFLGLY